MNITKKLLIQAGATAPIATKIMNIMEENLQEKGRVVCWLRVANETLHPDTPYSLLQYLFSNIYHQEEPGMEAPPAWLPTLETIQQANVTRLQNKLSQPFYKDLYNWSIINRDIFWMLVIEQLGIVFKTPYKKVVTFGGNIEDAQWLVGGELNIMDSCFLSAPDKTAIVYQEEGGLLKKMTYAELEMLVNRIANGLLAIGLAKGDAVAIDMPMTAEAVAIYLAVVKMGGAVVSIADSLAPVEVEKRLQIASTKAVFTQDVMLRAGKTLPLYQKLTEIQLPMTIVIPADEKIAVELRKEDMEWKNFLSDDDNFESVSCYPEDVCNILFSSGTTGDPKAIPWTHTTPIKCAADGYLHHDLHEEDVVAWPTNIGWMMGPWLIFAAMVNRCTIGLYYGAPTGKGFGKFVQDAKVNMLGLIPSIVKRWIETDCMKGLDWSSIKVFSSTGESSNPQDYLWLMCRGGWKPIIEYCGGTEIGGGYATGTVVQAASPSTFTTSALGMDFLILDDENKKTRMGELYILPPSIGLSLKLLNKNHHQVYFEDTPQVSEDMQGTTGISIKEQVATWNLKPLLRKHGDEIVQLSNGYFRAMGRADDTMNLGGIKTSSVEIERLLDVIEGVKETAAIAAHPSSGGPSQLVIYVVLKEGRSLNKEELLKQFHPVIKKQLNPLFRIMDIVLKEELPRTASNKVMRRMLRKEYEEKECASSVK